MKMIWACVLIAVTIYTFSADTSTELKVTVGGTILVVTAAAAAALKRKPATVDPLDEPLLHWSKDDPFTGRDLLNSVVCFGRTGSGKTSGSGKHILRGVVEHRNAFGRRKSGGLILGSKPEDVDDVRAIFRQANRSDDVLVINSDGELRCNFINYIRSMGGDTREITKAITTIAECLNSSDSDGREDGKYWEAQQERMIYNAVECVKLGTGNVTAPDLMRFVTEAAKDPSEIGSAEWQSGFHAQTITAADAAQKSQIAEHDFQLAMTYWLSEIPRMSSRTRSSIEAGVFQTLHVFNTGLVRELCSTTTNVSPDEALNGRWIFINLPPSNYGDSGKFVNAGWKFLMQKAVLRRKARPGDPINVIWCDEAQQWVNSHDSHYLAQCRSHLGCQVFLTQSLHSILGAMSGKSGQHQAMALLTNFSTKVMHACSQDDAAFASGLIGNDLQVMAGGSTPPNEDLWQAMLGVSQYSANFSEQIQPIVQPRVFMNGLRTGGKANGYLVDAIVVKSGVPFADGESFKFVTFDQRG